MRMILLVFLGLGVTSTAAASDHVCGQLTQVQLPRRSGGGFVRGRVEFESAGQLYRIDGAWLLPFDLYAALDRRAATPIASRDSQSIRLAATSQNPFSLCVVAVFRRVGGIALAGRGDSDVVNVRLFESRRLLFPLRSDLTCGRLLTVRSQSFSRSSTLRFPRDLVELRSDSGIVYRIRSARLVSETLLRAIRDRSFLSPAANAAGEVRLSDDASNPFELCVRGEFDRDEDHPDERHSTGDSDIETVSLSEMGTALFP